MEFNKRANVSDSNINNICNLSMLTMQGELTVDQVNRLEKIKKAWDFYEGYHWQDIPPTDKPQITENYCRPFVNKFVSFELGSAFSINIDKDTLDKYAEGELTHLDYLNEVWKDSKKDSLCIELGQSKSVTGDGWLQVRYYPVEELDDPFNEYPNGKILVTVIPTSIVFPEYNDYDKSKLEKVTIAYPVQKEQSSLILRKTTLQKVVYKQEWTKDRIRVTLGNKVLQDIPNKYKVIPFVQIKNYPIAGRTDGVSDLEDLIPLNMELNLKKSDISEIIDYHSAPITVVFGAKINQLERGANKVWGGLPKDAKVENLELSSDLGASTAYVEDLKNAMHDIGGVPKGALGGEQAISNTSGVALQFVNMPLIERNKIKKSETKHGLEYVNKLILYIAIQEGLFSMPSNMTPKEFYDTEVSITDNLPKDTLIELQQIETEIRLGLESREGAMRRLGKQDIQDIIEEIDEEKIEEAEMQYQINKVLNPVMANLEGNSQADQKDVDKDPKFTNNDNNPKKLNSGTTNGQTPVETVRKEITGKNND